MTVDKIRHIPGVIIHGRYDLVCPIRNAWDLHRVWPEAELAIVPNAGHAAMEPGTRSRLIPGDGGLQADRGDGLRRYIGGIPSP